LERECILRILITGSSGLIGSALTSFLAANGHEICPLVRARDGIPAQAIPWNPSTGTLPLEALEEADAVIHLAGENIAEGRWTAERKRRILESRRHGTSLLAGSLSRLSAPPRVLISASAIGYYGDRGEEVLNENSSPGQGFLADVCRQWEEAAKPAAERGIRLVTSRTGLVLSSAGGVLSKILLPYRMGLGGKIGSGRQYMSWIALDDLVKAIYHAIQNEEIIGPMNAVAPHPVTNLEFTKTLGRVLSRPTLLPLPAAAARLLLGEMADALLLASARVEPASLLNSGFRFQYPDLDSALRHLLEIGK
jgi:uncharacterized protein (TIGR01777 family)